MREGASQSCCDDDEAVSIEDGVKEKQARDILGILNCLSEPQLLDLQGGFYVSQKPGIIMLPSYHRALLKEQGNLVQP